MEMPTHRDEKAGAALTTGSLKGSVSAHLTIPEEDSVLSNGFQGDRIKVAVRVRPMFSVEELENKAMMENGTPNCLGDALVVPSGRRARHQMEERAWSVEGGDTIVQKSAGRRTPGRNHFTMDYIFDENSDTSTIYEEIARPIVQSVASGRHGTIFAYGQTGSGKTYTMQGGHPGCPSEGMGLTQMAMLDLFEFIDSNSHREWKVSVQYYEIYNEEVRDLIAPSCESHRQEHPGRSSTPTTSSSSVFSTGSAPSRRRSMRERERGDQESVVSLPILKVQEDQAGNVVVDAREKIVRSAEQCIRVLHQGNRNRASAATNANKHSSRSHAIFRVTLRSHSKKGDLSRVSVLNLVDLAGSENARQSGATSVRKREGGKINQSLLSLSRVIHSLSLAEEERPQHIGFRDSRLTRILQPHLSGNACISILCCATVSKYDMEETRSTLKFASNAKEIKIKPIVNEYVDEKESYMRLLKEVETLKASLRAFEERYGEESQILPHAAATATHTSDTVSSVGSLHHEAAVRIVGVFEASSQASRSLNGPQDVVVHREAEAPLVAAQSSLPAMVDPPLSEDDSHTFPLEEVELTRSGSTGADERVSYLEERIEHTESLVEKMYSDLNKSRHKMLESFTRNYELQEQLEELQQDVDDKSSRESIFSGWYLLMCIAFYAFGLQEWFVAAIIFFWLSLQTLSHSCVEDTD